MCSQKMIFMSNQFVLGFLHTAQCINVSYSAQDVLRSTIQWCVSIQWCDFCILCVASSYRICTCVQYWSVTMMYSNEEHVSPMSSDEKNQALVLFFVHFCLRLATYYMELSFKLIITTSHRNEKSSALSHSNWKLQEMGQTSYTLLINR